MSVYAGLLTIKMWSELYNMVVRSLPCRLRHYRFFLYVFSIIYGLSPSGSPREQNELADYYSRIVDCDDWMLNPSIFSWLDTIWGPHTMIGLQVLGMHSCKDLIQDFGSLARRL